MSDLKTFDEVVKATGKSESFLAHNLTLLKKKKPSDPERLIAGVDFIKTKGGREKYTPDGVRKLVGGFEHE